MTRRPHWWRIAAIALTVVLWVAIIAFVITARRIAG